MIARRFKLDSPGYVLAWLVDLMLRKKGGAADTVSGHIGVRGKENAAILSLSPFLSVECQNK